MTQQAVERADRRASRQRRRLLVDDLVEDLDRGAAVEGRPPCQHLVEHNGGGEEIGSRVGRLAAELLGRAVERCADQHPWHREPRRGAILGRAVRHAEIEQLGAVRREEDVRGLQIAMDDAVAVQGVQSREHAQRDRQSVSRRQRRLRQPLRQRLPLQQLHGQEELPVLLAQLVELTDGRMIDACRHTRLALEPLPRLGIGGIRPQRLDRDGTFEAVVVGRIDHAHASLAEYARNPVASDRGAHGLLTVAARLPGGLPLPCAW